MKPPTDDELDAMIPELARRATRAAFERALASGRPVVVKDGDEVVEIDKTGKRRVILRLDRTEARDSAGSRK